MHELFTQITVAAGNVYRAIFGASYPEYTYGLVQETGESHRLSKYLPPYAILDEMTPKTKS